MMGSKKIFFVKKWLFSRRYSIVLFCFLLMTILIVANVFNIYGQVINYLLILLTSLTVVLSGIDLAYSYQHFRLYLQGLEEVSSEETAVESLLKERLVENQKLLVTMTEKERRHQDDLMDYFTLWAHQIKTPLAASHLILRDLSEGEEKQKLSQEFFKIEQYVTLVLDYLRLESFHEDLQLREENLENLIHQVVKKYANFFIYKQIKLRLGNINKIVITDKKWLSIIIEQIISNSVKYTNDGQIDIFMRENWLFISDTGIGIAKSDLSRVFERGFSGYNGRLTQQSSGLGLYLTKVIADKLGYPIRIDSSVGQGTTLSIGFVENEIIPD